MKEVLLMAVLSVSSAAVAASSCGYGSVEGIVDIETEQGGYHTVNVLSAAEQSALEDSIGVVHGCDEGVVLKGVTQQGNDFYYNADCYADSLGSKPVSIQLVCKS